MNNNLKLGVYEGKNVTTDADSLFNQHLGIIGGSGGGKTVFAQNILVQLAQQGNLVFALDSHGALAPDQIFEAYEDDFNALVKDIDVHKDGFPVNLFDPITYEDGSAENSRETIGAIVEMLSRPINLGVRQKADLRRAVESVMKSGAYKTEGIQAIDTALSKIGTQQAAGVRERLFSLTENNVFQPGENLFEPGKISIVRLSKFDLETQIVLSEIFIAYLWRLATVGQFKKQPIYLFIDEVHNMPSGKNSTLAQMLSEGRRFGVNLILATQLLADTNKSVVMQRLTQSGLMLYFKPLDSRVDATASLIDPSSKGKWNLALRTLQVGEFVATGHFLLNGCAINYPLRVSNRQEVSKRKKESSCKEKPNTPREIRVSKALLDAKIKSSKMEM